MGYNDEVLADSPLAFWKLDETSPSGAGSILDSAGVGPYHATPNGAITWAQPGPLSVASSAALMDGTSGYISAGAALASTLMQSAAWTIEFWYYYGTLGTSRCLFAAAHNASFRVAIDLGSSGNIFTSSSVGGNKSMTGGAIPITAWHHVVLTSAGDLYLDGVAQTGTSGSSLSSTNNLTIGARNDGTRFYNARISNVAIYQSALSSTRVAAHFAAGVARSPNPGLTFYHDFEQDAPAIYPPGSCTTPSNSDAFVIRDTAQFYAGARSLFVGGGTFQSSVYQNQTDQNVWAPLDNGKITCWFRTNGTLPGSVMIFQITGKDNSGINDTNDSLSFRVNADRSGGSLIWNTVTGTDVTLNITSSFAADTWVELIVQWRRDTSPYLSVTLNGVTATSATLPGAFTCTAFHQILIGNDLAANAPGLWIDEFRIFGSWDGADSANPAILTGFGFFA